jgi:uncharacterized protein
MGARGARPEPLSLRGMSMVPSRHNIIGKLRGSERSFIVNPLSRSADLLSLEAADELASGAYANPQELVQKGYLVQPEEETGRYRTAYLDFLDARDRGQTQLFFVPWYSCNFSCPYCYQEGYGRTPGVLSDEVIDGFFRYVDNEFAGKPVYLTLFGGEPLLPGEGARRAIAAFLTRAAARNLGVAVVTNGYTLRDYMDVLRLASIREIQVTLDGVGAVHDRRRPLRDGSPTFRPIVEGINEALRRGFPVNLRVVLDRGNTDSLADLALLACDMGWTANPSFKTQLGRNYELHTCQADPSRLYSRVELYEKLLDLIGEHPEILEFHKPAFSLSKFLWENGELPEPLFDSCPGCKTEWAFDFTGRIYACTATVGKPGEELGTFYPQVSRQQDRIDEWQERDVTSITACRGCSLQLACGGGCAAVARNRAGSLNAPDCRPVRELLEMGMSLYFGKEDD